MRRDAREIAEHRGRIVKNSDDGFLADFFSLIGGEAGRYRFSMLQSTGIGDSGMPASDLRKARRAMYCPIGI